MTPELGQRFGPYEILGRLGGGGMGLVFRAWDERLHREVAVKMLHDDYTMPGMRERFLQEARAASALNHPNICTVFDIGEQDHNPYLVMELLEGETVKDRIARGALSAEEIVRYAIEISDALAVAHAKGIVHRDIKPANIFLVTMPNGKSQAKVLDFGLAKIELQVRGGPESQRLDLTLAGSTVGTLAYMSPEQARGESLDMRSDLFSLGIVLYEMATRQVPFRGTTSALMFVQLFSHSPEPVRNWNESIPRELEKVILKLLAKDRKARFQTAKELQDALLKVSEKLGRGGWLSKGSPAVVPLVRAKDPVARHKGPRRRSEQGESETRTGMRSAMEGAAPGSGSTLSRSLRRHDRDRSGGPEPGTRRSARASAVAVESGEILASPYTTYGEAAKFETVGLAASGWRRENDSLDRIQVGSRESALTRSRTGVMQLESGLGEAALGRDLAESTADESEAEDWIAASLQVETRTRFRIVTAAASIVMGVAVVAMLHSGLFQPLVLGLNDRLLLTVIQNRTADAALDGTVMQGIEIGLRQSRSLNVLGGEGYRAGLRQIELESGGSRNRVSEQRVAQKVGARAYLYGEVTRSETSYTIRVDVLKTDSNDKVATLEQTAARREEIPAAIGRIVRDIRAEVSEDSKAEEKSSIPLQATSSIDALHAYAVGEEAMSNGRTGDALIAYQRAATLDPVFVQASLRLAWLYSSEKAEVASANAAGMAWKAAVHASERVKLLAQFCYEMNASGDYDRASKIIRAYIVQYPHDVEGREGLARVLRAQGNLSGALLAAQQGYSGDPFEPELYASAELALIGMDRYDEALHLEGRARQVGLVPVRHALIVGYLAGKEDVTTAQENAMQMAVAGLTAKNGAATSYGELYRYGLFLDNVGRIGAGSELWRAAAAMAGDVPGLASTRASMLAQAALDRSLVENCTAALELVEEGKSLPKGPIASFHAGIAAALCGDQPYAEKTIAALQQSYPQSTAVAQYYVPELQAAAEIGINEPEKALDSLIALEPYDGVSLTPYLRGMARAAMGQMPAAILDFQVVQAHRGSALLLGGNSYPVAEVGVARAYASSRDRAASVEAYRRFLMLWRDADPGQHLRVESIARSK